MHAGACVDMSALASCCPTKGSGPHAPPGVCLRAVTNTDMRAKRLFGMHASVDARTQAYTRGAKAASACRLPTETHPNYLRASPWTPTCLVKTTLVEMVVGMDMHTCEHSAWAPGFQCWQAI